jgi:cytidine deaminase
MKKNLLMFFYLVLFSSFFQTNLIAETNVKSQLNFETLKKIIDEKFSNNEKFDKFSIKEGFYKDLNYLKNQKKDLSKMEIDMLFQWALDTQNIQSNVQLSKNEVLSSKNLDESIKQKLILEAQRARTFAYAPYSEFHVGCALLTKDGKIYSGANFENAAYGNTICAERSAIAKTVASINRGISLQKNKDIIAAAIVIRGGGGSPCGNCRQALNEFNPNMLIIMSDIDAQNIIEKDLSELLPMGFGPNNLQKAKVK